jgi:hypothetical protein
MEDRSCAFQAAHLDHQKKLPLPFFIPTVYSERKLVIATKLYKSKKLGQENHVVQ